MGPSGNTFLALLVILLANLHISATATSSTENIQCSGNGWIHYKETNKCFKLIRQYVSQRDAKVLCQKSVIRSTDPYPPILASIKSEDEQAFLTHYLFNISKVSSGIWIGGERRRNELLENVFQWSDGSDMDFQHWTSKSPTNEILKGCTELSSRLSHKDVADGEWIDVACEKPNWVLCEKGQDWSMADMQHAVLQLFKTFEETNAKLVDAQIRLNETENQVVELVTKLESTSASKKQGSDSSVPIGFVYMQLPGQQEPNIIWPEFNWEDISSSSLLTGNFFRVVGKNSEQFGVAQRENFPRITVVRQGESSEANSMARIEYPAGVGEKRRSAGWLRTGDMTLFGEEIGIDFETSGGEVRPQNVAVKIWKRVA